MSLFSGFGWTGPANRQSALLRRAPRRRSFVPHLEALEDRTLPSTFTVLNLNDSGAGSLRQAILDSNSAAGADVIQFAPTLAGTITLTTGELDITDELTIIGPGQNKLTISGNDASRIFFMDPDNVSPASITGLTIANGFTFGSGSPGLDDAGGAIFNARSFLTLTNCTFVNNKVNVGFGGGGGAIFNAFHLNISGCTFIDNFESVTSPDAFGAGGAIDALGGVTISNSTFTGNVASSSFPGGFGLGGAINNLVGSMSLTGCTFTDNRALGVAGGDGVTTVGFGQGGAINSFDTLTLSGCTFTNNAAVGAALIPGAPSNGGTESVGGAVAAQGFLSVSGCIFTGNQVIGDPGGSPGSQAAGGAILALGTNLIVTNSIFSQNSAIGGAGGSGGAGGVGAGGAIDISFFSTATITNSVFSHNTAIGGAGGAGASGGLGLGGALDVGSSTLLGFGGDVSVTLSGNTVAQNQAFGGAGGVGGNGGDGRGAGLSVLDGTVTDTGSTFSSNMAIGGDGKAGGSGGNGLGGGIYIGSGTTVGLAGSTVTGNHANGGSGKGGGSDGLGIGGGIYDLGSFTADIFTLITGNHASTSNNDIFP
jgi:hypothetical protein